MKIFGSITELVNVVFRLSGGKSLTISPSSQTSSEVTVQIPDLGLTTTQDMVVTNSQQTLTNKTLTSPTINTPSITGGTITDSALSNVTLSLDDSNSANKLTIASTSSLAADKTLTFNTQNGDRTISLAKNLTVSTGDVTLTGNASGSNVTLPSSGTVATLAGVETLTNKSLAASTTVIFGASDPTNQVKFTVGGGNNVTTTLSFAPQSVSKTISFPDITDTVVTNNSTSTLTNKSLIASNTTLTETGANPRQLKFSFSGAANGVTTLTANATGNQSLSLPSTSGTLIGTGDTGTVSGTMIASNAVDLTSKVTGLLPINNGGTGTNTSATNQIFAGPSGGSAGAPLFRSLVSDDLPIVPITKGGTGASSQQAAMDALAGTQSNGKYLRSDGAHTTLSTIQAADVPTLNQNTTGTAANVTGTVDVANGGTGATTAATALANLGAAANGHNTDIFSLKDVTLKGHALQSGVASISSGTLTPASNCSLQLISSGTTISMIENGLPGAQYVLVNESASSITIQNLTGAIAARQIYTGTGADYTLAAKSAVSVVYDDGLSKWFLTGGAGGAGGGLTPTPAATTVNPASAGLHYLTNTSGGAFTITLPAGASGSIIRFSDANETWDLNPLTIAPASGQKIDNLATNESLVCDVKRGWVELSWNTALSSWSIQSISATNVVTASATQVGTVSTGAQTFAGVKTFQDGASIKGAISGSAVAAGYIGEMLGTLRSGTNGFTYSTRTSTSPTSTTSSLISLSLNKGVYIVSFKIMSGVTSGTTFLNGAVYCGGTLISFATDSFSAVTSNAAYGTISVSLPIVVSADATTVEFKGAIGAAFTATGPQHEMWAIRIA